ncbi:MAG: hypothetical protein M1826_006503 [Phylliscum demangeonii]|nr:MAG: hypothetical protein M1826_006503 [Phylliscum demangeonii]
MAPPTIGTHNGHFHADEALAVSLLRRHPAYQPSTLVRTRDPARLATCHTVVDVGGEYDPARHRYDHHQRSFSTTFSAQRATKLSSAGLVWLHFGRALVAAEAEGGAEDDADVELLWRKLYDEFIEAIDATDNGISLYDPAALAAAGIERRFNAGPVTISALVGNLNPAWNEAKASDPDAAQAAEDARFLEASAYIGDAFYRKLRFYARSWLPARAIVRQAYAARTKLDPLGRIVVFDQAVPWRDHLFTIEQDEAAAAAAAKAEPGGVAPVLQPVLYALYPGNPLPDARWRIQAVPISKDSFESRKGLPASWRALRDEKLDAATGVPGGVFVHASGFTGGHQTWDGVVAMARKALADGA